MYSEKPYIDYANLVAHNISIQHCKHTWTMKVKVEPTG